VNKARAIDKLSFGGILSVWKWDEERIVRLTRLPIDMGRHPAVWMQASGVVISNHCKDNYTKLKAYRWISLLSCMGKVVENGVSEQLSE